MTGRVGLRLIIQPGRHVPHRHVVPDRIPLARFVDNRPGARREGYLGRLPCAEEFGVEVHAFAVDLGDLLGWIWRIAWVEVPSDPEQVARLELDLLVLERYIDGFCDVSLQSGHVAVFHAGLAGFPGCMVYSS